MGDWNPFLKVSSIASAYTLISLTDEKEILDIN